MTEYYSFHDRWAIWSSGYFSAFLVNLCVCFYITMTWWIGKGKLNEDDKCGMVEIVKMNKMHGYDSRAGIRCAFSYVFCRRNWLDFVESRDGLFRTFIFMYLNWRASTGNYNANATVDLLCWLIISRNL